MTKLAHAMWVHGNSLQIQNEDNWGSITRYGYCTEIEGKKGGKDTGGWVHFAVPTPVIINDKKLRLDSVMLRFHLDPAAEIGQLHVYDGDSFIANLSTINARYDMSSNEFVRWSVPNQPEVKYGVSMSIYVIFHGRSGNKRIEFKAAGCDFLPPLPFKKVIVKLKK